MTSDKERREVAKRLRRELDYMRERRAWYRSNVDAVECGNTAYRNIAASAIPYGNIGSDYIGVVEHLADLIDRPTCKLVEAWDGEREQHYLDCTACHFGRRAIEQDDAGGWYNARELWCNVEYDDLTHCPYCGAEVVRDGN